MMLSLLNYHILLLLFPDKINNTAISSNWWVPMIAKAARIAYSIRDGYPVVHDGVVFDEGLVLLFVEPV